MDQNILNKYFNLLCDNDLLQEFEIFQTKYKLTLPLQYVFVLSRICNNSEYNLNFFLNYKTHYRETHFYKIYSMYNFKDMVENYEIFLDNEIETKKWTPGFSGYNAKCLIPIANLLSMSELEGMFIDCSNDLTNGRLFVIDRNIMNNLNGEGCPIKVKIADSISHLLEIVESQKGLIPDEFL